MDKRVLIGSISAVLLLVGLIYAGIYFSDVSVTAKDTKNVKNINKQEWEILAEDWASETNVDAGVLKATVWSESEGKYNDVGDNGQSFGYGNVQPKEWPKACQWAIDETTGMETSCKNVQALGERIIANKETSMAVAAKVTAYLWSKSGDKNDFTREHFDKFTRLYVGSKVSEKVLDKRWDDFKDYVPEATE